ncbi:hypothetical protein KZP23_00985 [Echinicola marina]|uniref:hypothetical protein n=1 Tax=Echinicola marina TaxID=2859768 RepID=UPI001CF613BB|nr:hypothetical protein [Echinicola marina]UCS93646.1 hypothetical protein KZP23_00985 [Echinicola marina]
MNSQIIKLIFFSFNIIAFLFFTRLVFGQTPSTLIVLKPAYLNIKPDEFYFKEVRNNLGQRTDIGNIFTSREAKETEPLGLQGGIDESLSNYVLRSVPIDRSLRPVVLEVNECEITEMRSSDGLIEGKVELDFTFQLENEGALVHLLDYQGGAKYKRSSNNYRAISSALQQSLASSLKYFNDWVNQESGSDIRFAKQVSLRFRDYEKVELEDTVFYHRNHPLEWEDFRAQPHFGSKYAASIFSSFAWEGNTVIEDGVAVLDLVTKVFMLKSSSWVRSSSKDDYGLNHEQRHFDITKIIVERFKEKIKKMELSPDDYDGKIGYLYIETYREMNQMQEAYDAETSHGKNKAAQAKWNKLIDEELSMYLP